MTLTHRSGGQDSAITHLLHTYHVSWLQLHQHHTTRPTCRLSLTFTRCRLALSPPSCTSSAMSDIPSSDVDGADELQRLFLSAKAEEMAALAAQQKQHSSADTALAAKLSAHKLKKSQKLIDNAFNALQKMEEKSAESANREEERLRQKLKKGKRRRSVIAITGTGGQHGPLLSLLKDLPPLPAGVDVRSDDLYDALMLSAQHGVDVASADGRQLVVTLLTQLTAERPNRPPHVSRTELPQTEADVLQQSMRGATAAQRQWLEVAFQHPMLASIIATEEATLLASHDAAASARPAIAAVDPAAAAEAFDRLRKLFVGAIKRLREEAFLVHLDSMRELIDGGYFDLNDAMKENGETALHIACRHGKARIVEWLLQNGRVDVRSVTTPTRQTALQEALSAMAGTTGGARLSYEAVLQLLIAAGADVQAVNAEGVSASELARKAGVDIGGAAAAGDTMDGMLTALERVDGRLLEEESKQDALLRSKLQRGKANKTQRLMKAAIADADKLSTRQQTEEARQQQLLNDKLTQGRNAKAKRAQQRQQPTGPVDEPQWCEEMLLGWLSEETKSAIVALHSAYGSVEGVDLQLLARVKGLDGSEAELVVGGERSFGDDEVSRLQDALNGGGMDDEERMQVARIADVMRCNQCIYADVLAVLEARRGEKGTALTLLNNGQPPPFPDVSTTFASALPTSFQPQLPPPLLAAICTHLSAYLALLLPSPPMPTELSQGQVDWEALAAAGVDTEVLLGVLCMSVDDVSLLCVSRLKGVEDEKRALDMEDVRRAVAGGGWSVEEAEEVERLRSSWAASSRSYETMVGLIRQWREHGRMSDEMAAPQQLRPTTAEGEVDTDSGLSNLAKLQSGMIEQLQAMAAEHLGHTVEEMRGMSEADIRSELVQRGVDVDIMEEMRRLSEAEVGRYLAQQKAEKDAEADMIHKMLAKKGLTDTRRRQLEEKQKLLADAGRMYSDMMASLIAGEKKQGERMSTEEQAAHESMLAKMDEKRRRKQQTAQDADTGLSTSSKVKSVLVEQLREMAAEHLGRTAEEMAAMSESEVRQQLADRHVDIDILAEMARLSEAEVGQMLAKQKAERDAEAAMLRRMMLKKGLSDVKRAQLEAREKQLMEASRLFEDMLSSIVSGERKQGERMTAEEQAAHAAMMAKMEERRRRKADKQKDEDTGLSMDDKVNAVLVEQLQEMAADHLGRTVEEVKSMSEAEMKEEFARRGIDASIWAEMKRLTEAEMGSNLARQRAESEAEAAMIRKMLKGKGLTAVKRKQLEERERQLMAAAQLYEDMLSSLVVGERKQGEQRTKEEEAAHQAMLAKLESKRKRKEQATRDEDTGLATDEKVKEYVVAQLQEMAAEHLGRTVDELRGMSEDDVKSQLAAKGVDTDIWAELSKLSEAEVGKMLARQRAEKEAEVAMIRKMLKGKGLTEAKRNELQAREKQLVAAAQLYEDMLSSLVAGERTHTAHLSQQESAAHAAMIAKLEAKRRAKEATERDEDTGLSLVDDVEADMVQKLYELAAEHLGLSADDLKNMSEEEMKGQLLKKGVDVDILRHIQQLTEAEAGRYLARQKARNESEAAMIRKMLKGKGLTVAKRAELLERERQLMEASTLYDDMLLTLMSGEKRQGTHRGREEEAAYQRMLTKMGERRARKEQEEAQQKQDDGVAMSSSLLANLHSITAGHLNLLASASLDALASALTAAGAPFDLLAMLQGCTDAEAAQLLWQQRLKDEAELRMLRKLMAKGKGRMSDDELANLAAREDELLSALDLYDDMLRSVLESEKKRFGSMDREERAAYERMRDKLVAGKRRKQKQDETAVDDSVVLPNQLVGDNALLMHVIAPLAAAQLGLSAEQLAGMCVDEVQAALRAAGVEVDLEALLRNLMDSEAAQWMARQREEAEAERAMVRRLLAGKGRKLTADERKALEARERELSDIIDSYDEMFKRLLAEERKRRGLMDEAERRAYEELMARLRRGKKKQTAQTDIDPAQKIGDSPQLLDMLGGLAKMHLSLSPDQLAGMTVQQLQDALKQAGVDIDIMDMLRNLTDSEAARWLAAQREKAAAEADMLRKLLSGKGRKLTAAEQEEMEARLIQLEEQVANYDDLLRRLLEEELKVQKHMTEEERVAYERMMEKLRRGKKSKEGQEVGPQTLMGDNQQLLDLLGGLAASQLGLSRDQLAGMTIDEVQAALNKAGVDIDIMEMLRNLTDSEAAKWLAAQREKAVAEADMLRRLLAGKGRKLTDAERAAAEARLADLEAEIAGYDDLLRRLLEEEMKKMKKMEDEERLAYQDMMDRLGRGKKRKLPDTDIDPAQKIGDSPQLLDMLGGLAKMHLSLSPDQLAGMTVQQLQDALKQAGVDIDIMDMLRNLTDSEAARWLAAQREKAAAEADMLRKLLSGKGRKLTDAERADAEARLSQLEEEIANYDDLLRRLLDEEMRKMKKMEEEERLAYERMMEKLRRGKNKKEQQQPIGDVTPQTLMGDNQQLLDMLAGLADAHLGLSRDQLAGMTIDEVQAALNKAGVDIDIMEMLRNLTDSEAAKWLAAQREKAVAEADMLRRLLKGKKLTPKERQDAETRLAQLERDIDSYDELLRRLLQEELNKLKRMEDEERRAYEAMMDRLRRGKKKKATDADEAGADMQDVADLHSLRSDPRLRAAAEAVFDLLCLKGTYSCRRCLTTNTATASFCSLCLTPAPVVLSPILSAERLVCYHRTVHRCSGGGCEECVRRIEAHLSAPCIRSNFFDYLELLCVMCHRWNECSWDGLMLGSDERGLTADVCKKVWTLNQFDGGKQGEKAWQRLMADADRLQGEWIGGQLVRSDCAQVPDILDYV